MPSQAAKSDSRIKLIVLDLGNLNTSGLSKLQEIGAALRDFRGAGKRVVVAADSLDQTQYYLAAQAGEVYLDPLGLVYVDGFSYYRMFLKDAIDKLGVDVNVFRAGTFKSYTDQFSRSDMAPSEREESSVWLEALWNAYSQDVTRARSLPANALNEYVAEAGCGLGRRERRCRKAGAAARPGHRTEEPPADGRRSEEPGGRRSRHPFLQFHRNESVSGGGALQARASNPNPTPRSASSSPPARFSTAINRRARSAARAPPTCCARRATTIRSKRWCCASIVRAAACSPRSKSCAKCRRCAKPASPWSSP